MVNNQEDLKVWANMLVCNEDQFVWFSLMSVINFVDKLLVWDTGSTDKTVEIVKEVIKNFPDKIIFKECGAVNKNRFTILRQQQLEASKSDWILILDGDEIWWDESIKKVINKIKTQGKGIDAIAVPYLNAVGDIYHYQDEKAGKYQLLGRKGHLTVRGINKSIPGLHVNHPYGEEGYFDKDNTPVQDLSKVIFIDAPYLHATHLKRSSVSRQDNKYKYDLGVTSSKMHDLPEVFNQSPPIASNSLKRRSLLYKFIALLQYPKVLLRG